MLIGFLGDLHGRVFHALAIAAQWQLKTGKQFDLLIQVGDLGAFRGLERLDEATHRFAQDDPSELDFLRLTQASGALAEALQQIKAWLPTPIYFIRGNHEDMEWLRQLPADGAPVDPFDLFYYVPDGTVRRFGDITIAFLGGVETEHPTSESLDQGAYDALFSQTDGAMDILVTHQGPYGSGIGFYGDVLGSPAITKLITWSQPRYHVAGHYHTGYGLNRYGSTTSIGLKILVPSRRDDPELRVQPRSMAVLDTSRNILEFVTDGWLSQFSAKDFDLVAFVQQVSDSFA